MCKSCTLNLFTFFVGSGDRDQLCRRLVFLIEAMPLPQPPRPSRCSQPPPRKSGHWAVNWFIIKYKCDNINKVSQNLPEQAFYARTFTTWLRFVSVQNFGGYIFYKENLQPFLQLCKPSIYVHYYLEVLANPPKNCTKNLMLFLASMGEMGLSYDIFFKFSLRPFKVVLVE